MYTFNGQNACFKNELLLIYFMLRNFSFCSSETLIFKFIVPLGRSCKKLQINNQTINWTYKNSKCFELQSKKCSFPLELPQVLMFNITYFPGYDTSKI